MSKFAEELNRRIKSGEPVHKTREWYLRCFEEEPTLLWSDLTYQEQIFLEKLNTALMAWAKQQKTFR
jgi:hypothetical protein